MIGAAWKCIYTGVPGWETPNEQAMLLALARQLPEGGLYLEIGSEYGMSASIVCYGALPSVEIHCVDLFPIDYRGDMMLVLEQNLAEAGFPKRAIYHRGDSSEIGRERWGVKIDLLFIDGDHSLNGVRLDIAAWCRHVAIGGVVVFHDAAPATNPHPHPLHIEVGQAIDEWQGKQRGKWQELPSVDTMRAFKRIAK